MSYQRVGDDISLSSVINAAKNTINATLSGAKALPGCGIPVPIDKVTIHQQAYDYACNGYKDATKNKWTKAATLYSAAQAAAAGAMAAYGATASSQTAKLVAMLKAANAAASAEKAAQGGGGAPAVNTGGGGAPSSGIPWLPILILGGVGLYLLKGRKGRK